MGNELIKLPAKFVERMKILLGTEYDAFYTALQNGESVKGIRINTQKIKSEEFEKQSPFRIEKIPYADNGFIVPSDAQAGKHSLHHAGAYYMQDPGAMSAVSVLPTELWERNGLKIMDLCAAPGGKTTQLAARCAAKDGVVLANEYVTSRSRILAGNVERMGLSNVVVTNLDSKYIAELYPTFFDVVVVDAPCSGEGMYRKNDNAVSEWSVENVKMCAARQKEILENAVKTVSSGGYLVYSTCTYSTEENEEVIAQFLDKHTDFHLCECGQAVTDCTADGVDVSQGKYPELKLCRRFYPHLCRGEGQFVALLRRSEDVHCDSTVKDAFAKVSAKEEEIAADFMTTTIGKKLEGLCMIGGNLALFPLHLQLPLPYAGVVSAGVTLGSVRKGRLIPHHHYFSAFGKDFISKHYEMPESDVVLRYISGEETDVAAECFGYTALMLKVGDDAVTLGGGKVVDGRLKNYYPKGLRQLNLYNK